jgi:hypothetical protein
MHRRRSGHVALADKQPMGKLNNRKSSAIIQLKIGNLFLAVAQKVIRGRGRLYRG